ncbi:hypothetical protein C7B64_21930 [Merismopedia glauca CCAP 1448/3]|uniref:Uncharacterized protein n=1 Tax=Merismopedia glauca CCAP 1448/3 TaxID=1296344 RepID=A0A2T1BXK6_9CYAN|nr:hypothetical protein C7B64_21930 [Merismopedia glauca CCAP 1448/3]
MLAIRKKPDLLPLAFEKKKIELDPATQFREFEGLLHHLDRATPTPNPQNLISVLVLTKVGSN